MLVTGYRQHPTTHSLAVHRLGLPWTIRLLGGCLMFCCHTSVWSTASIANEIASYYIIAGDVGTTHFAAMRSCFDNLVAFLFHAIIQLLEQLLIRGEDAGMGDRNGLEDAKHGDVSTRLNAMGVDDVWIWPLPVSGVTTCQGLLRWVMNFEMGSDNIRLYILPFLPQSSTVRTSGRCRETSERNGRSSGFIITIISDGFFKSIKTLRPLKLQRLEISATFEFSD